MAAGYKWRSITDLPTDWEQLSDGELSALLQVWKEQRVEMERSGVLASFNERLHRRWAIETGIIESVYSLDRGTTELLISRGIDATLIPHNPTTKDPVTIAHIVQDHADVLKGLFAFVRSERPLSTSYIKELHAALLRHSPTTVVEDQFGHVREIEIDRGAYKTLPNDPRRPDGEMHEYCPPEHVPAEMDRLVELHRRHETLGVPVEVQAAWLHHRFTQIHPFTDGNGRVARALASLLFLKAGWFPVVIDRDSRVAYIDALELADYSNLSPLVDLFVRNQRRSYVDLLNVRDEIAVPQDIDAVIASAREVLIQKHAVSKEHMARVYLLSRDLRGEAERRFSQVADKIRAELRAVPDLGVQVSGSAGLPEQALKIAAEALGYDPQALTVRESAAMYIHNPGSTTIGIAFVQIGRSFHGIMGAVGIIASGSWAEPAGDVFQFNYHDDNQALLKRFRGWLDLSLSTALRKWRARIG